MRTIIIVIIACLSLSASCGKKNRCNRDYTLEHPVSVYPVKESYNIGDTIWIEMNFSDTFTLWYPNTKTMNEYYTTSTQLKDFDFHRTGISIFKSSDTTGPISNQEWSYNKFTPIYLDGMNQWQLDGLGIAYKYNYNHHSNTYYYKLGLICDNSGVFLVEAGFANYHHPSQANGVNDQNITPECERERIYDIQFPINRQSDGTYLTNYHIFEQYMNPALENDIERIKNRSFTIKVN